MRAKHSAWILVVDDDVQNLKVASRILDEYGVRVSCLTNGSDAIKFLMFNKPDLVLLDVHMPGMDGFETMEAMKERPDMAGIPVIFLTADEDGETETRGFRAGAMDFIRKPFNADVLTLRTWHAIELDRLQDDMAKEVESTYHDLMEEKQRGEHLIMQLVRTMSGAIDAKDSYTNGHSNRVAEYAKMIAKRAGYDDKYQEKIYMMGMLHDIGKIGVRDDILTNPGKLPEAEYKRIQEHPAIGAGILRNITEYPELATGAHWHHERYDGKGYPDGLKGEQIPEEARIIAVADAYDAMSSTRSYRANLTQAEVRRRVEEASGTQLDPRFAQIMLAMIDEDKEYNMRETD